MDILIFKLSQIGFAFNCNIAFTNRCPHLITVDENTLINKILNLSQGDMLIYRGDKLEHWRESFLGQDCAQVFLHYKDSSKKDSYKYLYDGRPTLGISSELK